jgi:hypothetical protein
MTSTSDFFSIDWWFEWGWDFVAALTKNSERENIQIELEEFSTEESSDKG